MADPFDLATARQRAVVLAAILAYFALYAVQLVTGNPEAAALADLVIAALAIPAGFVVARRATARRATDRIALVAALAFLTAGVAIGYGGLAALTDLEPVAALEAVGSLGLLIAVGLYIYRTWQ